MDSTSCFGGALFGHGTLTATMNRAPAHQAGFALSAWGAVQATATGLAIALSGTIRDVVNATLGGSDQSWGHTGIAGGYIAVYGTEIVLLLVTIAATVPLFRSQSSLRLDEPVVAPQPADACGETVT